MAKRKGSFLAVFSSIGHALEAAATIAAPIVGVVVDPQIGALIMGGAAAAVGMEAAVTADGAGPQKAAAVAAQTQAAISVVNGILAAHGKAQLKANAAEVIATQVGVVVSQMNAIRDSVELAPADSAVAAVAPAGAKK